MESSSKKPKVGGRVAMVPLLRHDLTRIAIVGSKIHNVRTGKERPSVAQIRALIRIKRQQTDVSNHGQPD